ncbi:unnamed protein product [Plutella xylostella]|uniref:(diamondback moth) hypothetical protein n=1 Tax=Plutella xylostella TaxID=51655 RepID=A0A8S4FXQ6_PLUXY|nr:unnamed protein product [Plutella xylostella]
MSSRRSILGSTLDTLPAPSDPLRELFEACKTGDTARVKKLITPQNVNARDTAGRKSTPLHFAAGYGRREVVEILTAAGAALQARDDGGLQPLHNACSFGHADVVRALLAAGAPPAARDHWGYTPLHEAAAKGKLDVCIALLQHGADPNIRNSEGKTPLDLADAATRPVLTGEYCAGDVLEAARAGADDRLAALLTPLNVNYNLFATPRILPRAFNLPPSSSGEYCAGDVLEAARAGADDRLAALLTPLNVNVHASDGRRSTPLHLAAGKGSIDCRKLYKDRLAALLTPLNVNVHASDGRRSTPLHLVAGYNRARAVRLLLQRGADVHAKDKGGLVPLHNACSYGHYEVTEQLVRRGADVNATDLWAFTPLHEAASKARQEVCSLLLSEGADPTLLNCHGKSALDVAPTRELQERLAFEYRGYCLLEACRLAEPARVKKYLSSSSNQQGSSSAGVQPPPDVQSLINFQHVTTGDTPLHAAAASPHAKRKLVSHHHHHHQHRGHAAAASPHAKRKLHRGHAAAASPHAKRKLVSHHHHHHQHRGHAAAASPHAKRKLVLEMLIRKGARVNEKNKEGQTPLHVATEHSHLDAMDLLLRHGAKVNACSTLAEAPATSTMTRRDSACRALLAAPAPAPPSDQACANAAALRLLEASRSGDVEAARALLDARPRLVNCRDVDGRHSTPLHFAAGYNRLALAQLLIQRGADVHAKDKGGLVPLHNACSYGHVQLSALLLQSGAAVDAHDLWRYTPLHEAAAKGKSDVVKLLLKHGADPTRRNRDGLTALQLARPGDADTADALRGDAALLDAAKRGDVARASSSRGPATPTPPTRYEAMRHCLTRLTEAMLLELEQLARPGDADTADALRGDAALLDAAKRGDVARARKLITPQNVNCRDTHGRNSTPLHLAAGYNNLEVAALLLEAGAAVSLRDKGGLVPLHNAASYGHAELAALLLRAGTPPNAHDRWGFTPLHEAAHKARTQLCALLAVALAALLLRAGTPPNAHDRWGFTRCTRRRAQW